MSMREGNPGMDGKEIVSQSGTDKVVPQGLKPGEFVGMANGTAEAVPFQNVFTR